MESKLRNAVKQGVIAQDDLLRMEVQLTCDGELGTVPVDLRLVQRIVKLPDAISIETGIAEALDEMAAAAVPANRAADEDRLRVGIRLICETDAGVVPVDGDLIQRRMRLSDTKATQRRLLAKIIKIATGS